MTLKQRAEQSSHTEPLGWEEEEEGMSATLLLFFCHIVNPVTNAVINTVTLR